MQDFSVEGVHKMFGGSDFSRVERNFTIGQSPRLWGNFSKYALKLIKCWKKYWENSRNNANVSENFF